MTPDIKQYIYKFSRNLNCSKKTRLKLSNGLKEELSIYQDLSYSELCEKMGNPEHLALQMMEAVDQNEIIKANRKRFLPFILIISVLLICVIFLSLYYIHTRSVMRGDFYVIETTRESEPIEIPDKTIEEVLAEEE